MTRYTTSRQQKDRKAATPDTWVTCACGKRLFPTKRTARAAAKALQGSAVDRTRDGISRLRAYPACSGNGYHFGHDARRAGNLNDPRLTFVDDRAAS